VSIIQLLDSFTPNLDFGKEPDNAAGALGNIAQGIVRSSKD